MNAMTGPPTQIIIKKQKARYIKKKYLECYDWSPNPIKEVIKHKTTLDNITNMRNINLWLGI